MSNNCKAMWFDREGRSYESTSVLLARIKSDREANVTLQKVPQRRGHKKMCK
jgi:hypothetical protein